MSRFTSKSMATIGIMAGFAVIMAAPSQATPEDKNLRNVQHSQQSHGPDITARPTTFATPSTGCSRSGDSGCTPQQRRAYSLHGK